MFEDENQSIGDELHLLFVCCNAYLVNLSRIYLPRYYVTYPSIVKMNGYIQYYMAK
jgi:predicted RNA polymerase sigma factor